MLHCKLKVLRELRAWLEKRCNNLRGDTAKNIAVRAALVLSVKNHTRAMCVEVALALLL